MTLVFKQIKPQRLLVEAMRAALEAAANQAADEIEVDFQKTTASWTNKPIFEKLVDLGPPITVLVGTDDEIYGYVDLGTRPHVIRPKRAKALRFQSGYVAKTTPGVIGSSAGGPFGDTVFSRGVNHPGTKARNFSKGITELWQTKFKRKMEQAMSSAAKASGHAL